MKESHRCVGCIVNAYMYTSKGKWCGVIVGLVLPHLHPPSALWASSSLDLHVQHRFLFFCAGRFPGKKSAVSSSLSIFCVWAQSVIK